MVLVECLDQHRRLRFQCAVVGHDDTPASEDPDDGEKVSQGRAWLDEFPSLGFWLRDREGAQHEGGQEMGVALRVVTHLQCGAQGVGVVDGTYGFPVLPCQVVLGGTLFAEASSMESMMSFKSSG